jgi:hypothetical protein
LLWDKGCTGWFPEIERYDVKELTLETVKGVPVPKDHFDPTTVSIHDEEGRLLFEASPDRSLLDGLMSVTETCHQAHAEPLPEAKFVLVYTRRNHELQEKPCDVLSITVYTFPKGMTTRQWVDRHVRRPSLGLQLVK